MPGFEIFGDEERRQVMDVLETGVLFRYGFENVRNGHFKAKQFEQEVVKQLGTGYCHLCSSGTAALSIALAACGIGAGDEVIVPPFTFIATIEAVLNAGAVPVFSEIDETLCLDPRALERVLTSRTKAVIPVHMCGAMAKIDEIQSFCRENKLIMVEDACQSYGGQYLGKALGTFGDMGCFSFDPVKTVTCGEGGAVITDDRELYQKADAYSDHGHDHVGNDRGLEGHEILGVNYRISELNAAVGVAQVRKINAILEIQRKNKAILKEALSRFSGVKFRELPDEEGDTATFLSFFLKDKATARQTVKDLAKTGVDGCFYWYDNNWHYIRQWQHLHTLSSSAPLPIRLIKDHPNYGNIDLPQSDSIIGRMISMQIKLSWTEKDLAERVERMASVFA